MSNIEYQFFKSRYNWIKDIKETEKIKISLVFYEGTQATCILKQYKNRDLSDLCQALMNIRHPNVAIVYDYVYEGQDTYSLEEMIIGETLSEIMEEKGTFSEKDTRNIIADVCEGLEEFHMQKPPIVHNDIKTSNIMIREDGCVKLIDFDVSRRYREGADKNTHLYGTKEYASPEHFGFGQSEPRSDIYSIGVTMHEMLTGKGLDNDHQIAYKGSLARIIKKCIQVDRKKRYKTVKQLKQDLEKKPGYLKKIVRTVGLVCLIGIAFSLGLKYGLGIEESTEKLQKQEELEGTEEFLENEIVTEELESRVPSALNETSDGSESVQESTDYFVESTVLQEEKKMLYTNWEGDIRSIGSYKDQMIILQETQDGYFLVSGDKKVSVEGIENGKLVHDPYTDALYLFDKMTVYVVDKNLKLSLEKKLDFYPMGFNCKVSFYSDGVILFSSEDVYGGDDVMLVDSNEWNMIGEYNYGQYVVNDKLYRLHTAPDYYGLFIGFSEIDEQGNIIQDYELDISPSLIETNIGNLPVYVDGTSAYFIVTIEKKEYLYRFNGTIFEEIICLNDYRYYSDFKCGLLYVINDTALCYDSSTQMLKEFKIE